MILRRVIEHVREQNWTAIAIDFVIVVAGVFVGIQVANWNEARRGRTLEAEYIARLLPRGTHRYADFIKPSELASWLREAGLQIEDVSGLFYDPLRQRARLSSRTEVNYLACARKAEA